MSKVGIPHAGLGSIYYGQGNLSHVAQVDKNWPSLKKRRFQFLLKESLSSLFEHQHQPC